MTLFFVGGGSLMLFGGSTNALVLIGGVGGIVLGILGAAAQAKQYVLLTADGIEVGALRSKERFVHDDSLRRQVVEWPLLSDSLWLHLTSESGQATIILDFYSTKDASEIEHAATRLWGNPSS